MSDCSRHKKDLFGKTDMKEVAEAIGDLSYPEFSLLLYHLSDKLFWDGEKDSKAGRVKLSEALFNARNSIHRAHQHIDEAAKISKPFMNPTAQ